MGKGFERIEAELADYFAQEKDRSDSPLGWGIEWVDHQGYGYGRRRKFLREATPFCEAMLAKARAAGAFGEEGLRAQARSLASEELSELAILWREPSERAGREAGAEEDVWRLAGAARRQRAIATHYKFQSDPLIRFERDAAGQMRAKASLLRAARAVAEDPQALDREIDLGLRESKCPWKGLLARELGLGGDLDGEPGWGAEFLEELERAREGFPKDREKEFWAESAKRIRELEGFGLPTLFGRGSSQGSLLRTGLGMDGAEAGEDLRDLALRLALEEGKRDPKALREQLEDPEVFASLLGLRRGEAGPGWRGEGFRDGLRRFIAEARRSGAWPDPLPRIDPERALEAKEAFGNDGAAIGLEELLRVKGGKALAKSLYGGASEEDLSRMGCASAAKVAKELGLEGKIERACELWAKSRAEDGEVAAGGGFEAARDAGLEGLVSEDARLRIMATLLRAGREDEAERLRFSPSAAASAKEMLEVAAALPLATRGRTGKDRKRADEVCARVMDDLAGSAAFRDALAQSAGKRGLGAFSAFCGDYARIAAKLKGDGQRMAALEGLRMAGKLGARAKAAPPSRRSRGL